MITERNPYHILWTSHYFAWPLKASLIKNVYLLQRKNQTITVINQGTIMESPLKKVMYSLLKDTSQSDLLTDMSH